MSDTEIPADLIALKAKFYTTDRELTVLSRAEPYDSAAWRATHNELGELAVQIDRVLRALPPVERLKLDKAASAAAREQIAAQGSAGG